MLTSILWGMAIFPYSWAFIPWLNSSFLNYDEFENQECLPISGSILAQTLKLVESTQVVFAFLPDFKGRSRADCVAKLLYSEKLKLEQPFMFWEIPGRAPRKTSVLNHFQEMASYASVTLIPLSISKLVLLEWMDFARNQYGVFDWLWIGQDLKELKSVEKNVADEGLGCRFLSLSLHDKGLCKGKEMPAYCNEKTEHMIVLKIPEIPVLLCRTKRVVLAVWTLSYDKNGLKSKLIHLETFKNLIFNRTILIGTITMAPFMTLGEKEGELVPTDGIDEGLIKAFAQYLSFRTPKDALWGKSTNNGTWTGLVGMIQRQEIDYGFTALSITPEKQNVIDYSIPNFFDSVTFLTRKPRILSSVYALILPYSFDVWLYVCFTVLSCPLVIDVMFRILPASQRRTPIWHWSEAALYMFGAVTQHGSGCDLPKPNSVRIVIGSYWLFCLVFFTGYAGTLVSFLNFPSTEEPVDTTVILLERVKQGTFKVGTITDSQVLELLNASDVKGIFKILKSEFEGNKTQTVVANHEEGIELATRNDYALISASSLMEATAAKMGMDRILFAKDRFYFFQYGLGFHKGSLFRNIINVPLYRLIEAGIMNKGWKDMVDRRKIQFGIQNRTLINQEGARTGISLTLTDLQGVFFITSFAIVATLLVLLTEAVGNELDNQKRERQRLYNEVIMLRRKLKLRTVNKQVQRDMPKFKSYSFQ